MADNKHVEMLKKGVAAWNAWRRKHFVAADFIETSFLVREGSRDNMDLQRAELFGANLSGADLRAVSLIGANLWRPAATARKGAHAGCVPAACRGDARSPRR
jgi:Pentapeptide repeats (8 copies)